MADFSSHSKFVFANYNAIQDAIDKRLIDVNDIVITKDTQEMFLVRSDLSLFSIKSKTYVYSDVETAEKALNNNSDTYVGQIIAILSDDKYKAFIVNKNNSEKFIVTSVNPFTDDSIEAKIENKLNETVQTVSIEDIYDLFND